MFGLIRWTQTTLLQHQHFNVETLWKVAQKAQGRAVIRILNAQTKELVSTVTVEEARFG